jgi:hypothetical protein
MLVLANRYYRLLAVRAKPFQCRMTATAGVGKVGTTAIGGAPKPTAAAPKEIGGAATNPSQTGAPAVSASIATPPNVSQALTPSDSKSGFLPIDPIIGAPCVFVCGWVNPEKVSGADSRDKLKSSAQYICLLHTKTGAHFHYCYAGAPSGTNAKRDLAIWVEKIVQTAHNEQKSARHVPGGSENGQGRAPSSTRTIIPVVVPLKADTVDVQLRRSLGSLFRLTVDLESMMTVMFRKQIVTAAVLGEWRSKLQAAYAASGESDGKNSPGTLADPPGNQERCLTVARCANETLNLLLSVTPPFEKRRPSTFAKSQGATGPAPSVLDALQKARLATQFTPTDLMQKIQYLWNFPKDTKRARKEVEVGTALLKPGSFAVLSAATKPGTFRADPNVPTSDRRFRGENVSRLDLFLNNASDITANDKTSRPVDDEQVLQGDGYHVRRRTAELSSGRQSLPRGYLDGVSILVGPNIRDSLQHLWLDEELQAFFRRGGKVWCVNYAQLLLEAFNVREGVAVAFDQLSDIERSISRWVATPDHVGTGKEKTRTTTTAASPAPVSAAVVSEFCLPVSATAEECLKWSCRVAGAYAQQVTRAIQLRMVRAIVGRMEGLLATGEMEVNGLRVAQDAAAAEGLAQALHNEIHHSKVFLSTMLPSNLMLYQREQFSWSNNHHVGYWLYGSTKSEPSHAAPGAGEKQLLAMPESIDPIHIYRQAAELAFLYYAKFQAEAGDTAAPPTPSLYLKDEVIPALLAADLGLQRDKAGEKLESNVELWQKLVADMHQLHYGFTQQAEAMGPDAINTMSTLLAARTRAIICLAKAVGADPKTGARAQLTELILLNPETNECFQAVIGREGAANYQSRDEAFKAARQWCENVAASAEGFSVHRGRRNGDSAGESSPAIPSRVLLLCGSGAVKEVLNNGVDIIVASGFASKVTYVDAVSLKNLLNEYRGKIPNKPAAKIHNFTADFATLKTMSPKSTDVQTTAAVARALWSDLSSGSTTTELLLEVGKIVGTVGSNAQLNMTGARARALFPNLQASLRIAADNLELIKLPVFRWNGVLPAPIMTAVKATCGGLSTSEAALKVILSHPQATVLVKEAIDAITKLRKNEKILQSVEKGNSKSIVGASMESVDGLVHHELLHHRTVTGRLSSQNPNCQNIPKDAALRSMFVSRFTDDTKKRRGAIMEADFSQLEVIAAATLALDETMLHDLEKKIDFHCKRVVLLYPHLTYEEVLRKSKEERIPEFVRMRSQAKIFSFQALYGAGNSTIAHHTGLSIGDVERLRNADAAAYPDVEALYQAVVRCAQDGLVYPAISEQLEPPVLRPLREELHLLLCNVSEGSGKAKATTVSNHALLDRPTKLFSRFALPTGTLLSIRSENPQQQLSTKTPFVRNYPVQGFAGELVQVVLGKLFRRFAEKRNFGGAAVLTNTVHDCVWIDLEEQAVPEVADNVIQILTSIPSYLHTEYPELFAKKRCSAPIPTQAKESSGVEEPPLKCPDYPIEVVVGPSMAELVPLERWKKRHPSSQATENSSKPGSGPDEAVEL